MRTRRRRRRRDRDRGNSGHRGLSRRMGTTNVLPVHGHPDCDRRQHQHRDADVPVRDADRKHNDQDNETNASNAAGCSRGLPDCTVGSSRVGGEARPESAWEAMAEVEAHAPFWPTVRALPPAAACTHNDRVPETTAAPPLTERFAAAFTMAWEVHGHQLRKKTRIPYIAHVMAVCSLALEHGADEDVAIAALLHDAIEDSVDGAATQRRIDRTSGGALPGSSPPAATPRRPRRAQAPVEGAQGALSRPPRARADEDALLVSACDKVHNAGSILTDLRTEGDKVWQRFTVPDPHEQPGTTSASEHPATPAPGPLTEELARLVEAIRAHIG